MANESTERTNQQEGQQGRQEGPQGQQQGQQERERSGRSSENRSIARQERQEAGVQPAATLLPSPFTFMGQFVQDMARLLDSFAGFGGGSGQIAPYENRSNVLSWFPAVEVQEREGQLVVRADIPGLNADDIRLELDDGQLVISGERTQEHEENEGGIYRTERSYGVFRRVIALPEGVDVEHATATFDNGVLEVTIPAPGRSRGRRLEIRERSKQSGGGQKPQQPS